jgi:hypothetical protein
MTKHPPPGMCVLCLKPSTHLTWDHVFPKSWYPLTTPPNIEKWKIPACSQCNKKFGKLEEELLLCLGLCVDPQEQKSLGINDKVLRAINPLYAKNDRDKKFREAKRRRIIEQLRIYDTVPKKGILPNFIPYPSKKHNGYAFINIPEDYLFKLGEKIVRGITYLSNKVFLDETYNIKVDFIENNKAEAVAKTIEKQGVTNNIGPGILVKYAITSDRVLSLWLIEIWGKLKMYVTVIKSHQPN